MDYYIKYIIWEKEECGSGCKDSYIREKRVVMCRVQQRELLNRNWTACLSRKDNNHIAQNTHKNWSNNTQ